MANTVDFNKIPKKYLTVKLADEEKTTLLIRTPPKKVISRLLETYSAIQTVTDDDIDDEMLDNLYDICSQVMSCNKGGIYVSKEKLENLLDFEDMIVFFKAYVSFIEEISNEKN